MESIEALLDIMVKRGASDLHLKSGSPPVIRVDGELYMLGEVPIMPEGMKEYAAVIMSDKQIAVFSEQNEVDFAYGVSGSGRLINVSSAAYCIAMRR